MVLGPRSWISHFCCAQKYLGANCIRYPIFVQVHENQRSHIPDIQNRPTETLKHWKGRVFVFSILNGNFKKLVGQSVVNLSKNGGAAATSAHWFCLPC